MCFFFFFFNDTAPTEIYTLSLHDALPIFTPWKLEGPETGGPTARGQPSKVNRSEEHTSELQSQSNLVCRLLLEKKKKHKPTSNMIRNTLNTPAHYELSSLVATLRASQYPK